jgi:hypothetical protein
MLSVFGSKLVQLKASDFGVVFGIMMLEMELQLTDYISAMVARLSELSGIRPTAVDCDGPDLTCENDLREVMERKDEQVIKDAILRMSQSKSTVDSAKKLEHQFMVMIFDVSGVCIGMLEVTKRFLRCPMSKMLIFFACNPPIFYTILLRVVRELIL